METLKGYKQGAFGEDLKILKSDDEVVIWFKALYDGEEKMIDIRMDHEHAKILGQTLIEATL